MRVHTIKDVRLRVGAPQLSARVKGIIFQGFDVEVVRQVQGDTIEGNDRWYQDRNGDFFWSGGVTEVLALPPPTVPLVPVGLDQVADDDPRLGWGLRQFDIHHLWRTTRGEGVRVGILDTGIDLTHPALNGVLAGPEDFADFRDTAVAPEDRDGHGTKVASIIAARGSLLGIAPACHLSVARIMRRVDSGFTLERVEQAINWAVGRGVQVLTMSFGAKEAVLRAREQPIALLNQAVANAVERGVFVVAAIGNEGKDVAVPGNLPALCPGCVSVGSVDETLALAGHTERAPGLTVCGPGVAIPLIGRGGVEVVDEGTSFAAPFVAGVAALLLAHPAGRSLSPPDLKRLLVDTSIVREIDGFSFRIIQPMAAVQRLTL